MLYPRSHTDPIGNLVILSAIDIRRQFSDLVNHDFPIHTLPNVLHEATHHWCFDSPVGLALHLLFLRARRSALKSLRPEHFPNETNKAFEDVIRYEMALRFFRPISEGLALFAEHDISPGESKSISAPLRLVASMYGRAYGALAKPDFRALPIVLAAGRVSPNHIRRKADLFIQPLNCSDGGYLAGYLLVKSLWHQAMRKSSMFVDRDFFLQFLRDILFSDWQLVTALLDDSISSIDGLERAVNRIRRILADFVRLPDGDALPKRFELLQLNNEKSVLHIRTDVIHYDVVVRPSIRESDAVEVGTKRLVDWMTAFFYKWPSDERDIGLLHQELAELDFRGAINLGHSTISADISDAGLNLLDDTTVIGTIPLDQVDTSQRRSGAVDIDVLTTPSLSGLCLLLTRGTEVLSLIPIGDFVVPKEFATAFVGQSHRLAVAQGSQELIRAVISAAGKDEEYEFIRDETDRQANLYYLPIALHDVDDEKLAYMKRLMENDGLLPVLNDELDLAKDAAAISLCLPSGYSFAVIKSFHTWSRGDALASLRYVNQLVQSSLGFTPFPEHNGKTVPISLL